MKKLFLIDGSGYIFRAYHALPPFSSPDGTPVGAVYGFCNMALKLRESDFFSQDSHLLVVFDAARKTFRQDIYPNYKAHRPAPPEDLIPQFKLIRDTCEALQLPHMDLPGFEADDIIASYTLAGIKEGYEVVIVSSDKDLMQLIMDNVSMYDPLKSKVIKEPEVIEKFGVMPCQVADVLSLMGDASDNIPGIPGIGPKTASQLIQEFETLDNLYASIHQLKPSKRKDSLIENKALADISKKLILLKDDVPLQYSLDQLKVQPLDVEKASNFFKNFNFQSLIRRMQTYKDKPTPPQSPISCYVCITKEEDLIEWLKEASTKRVVAIDTETTSLNAMEAKLVGISASFQDHSGIYIPLNHETDQPQISLDRALNILNPLLTDSAIVKVGHNLKYDLLVLKKYGVDITPINDTLLMSYTLDIGLHRHNLDELALKYFNHKTISYDDVTKKGKNRITFDFVPLDQATQYAAEDADICLKLYGILKERLFTEKLTTFYERTERPLIKTIVNMEWEGILIDQKKIEAFGKDFMERIIALENEIYRYAGKKFNVGSPKQLGEILFDQLKYPNAQKTKTGQYATDSDVLEDLSRQGLTLADSILSWRMLTKLNTTYVEGLLAAINPHTQRIHTSFSLAGTTTGRLSSSEPNLQNIPIRTPDGQKIRSCFIAKPGSVLLSLDYSQIELRLLAHAAKVPSLIEAFKMHQDVHSLTASQVFNVPLDQVSQELRRRSKAINFGIIYGISPYGLSQNLKVTLKEAKEYIDYYFNQYPEILIYMESTKKMAREKGYVETPFGRRCHIQGIHDKNPAMRQFAERQAINAPLQGGNADLMKRVMVQIHDYLKPLQSKLLLQVHDEVVLECPEKEVEQVKKQCVHIMENITNISVPLEVGVGIGKDWQSTKE